MKTAWKWILGILLVLVIVAVVVAVPLVMRNYMTARFSANANNAPQPQKPGQGWYGGNMMPRFDNRQAAPNWRGAPTGPMMGGKRGPANRGFGFGGFMPFGFGMMFLSGLFHLLPWVLLALIFWGVYQLGRRSGLRETQKAAPVAVLPVEPAAPQVETPQDPAI